MWRWLALALLAALGVLHLATFWWPFEDLYITLRYGDNLASGLGLRFNPGETVDGYTSFAWVLLAALGSGLSATDTALQVIGGAAGLALVAWLHHRLVSVRRMPVAVATATAAIVCASGTWAFWSASGMETSSFALAIFAAAVLAADDAERPSAYLVLGLAALIRPEGMGYSAAILAAVALSNRRAALRGLIIVAAVFGPYFVWHWAHFGYPLPNTFYAKASPSGETLWRGVVALEHLLSSQMWWLLVGGAGWAAARHFREPWVRIHAAVAAAALANIVVVGGDVFNFHRFALPALAPLCVLFGRALTDLADHLRPHTRRPTLAVAGLAVALALWAAAATVMPPLTILGNSAVPPRQRARESVELYRDFFAVGDWLADNVPGDTLLATNAAGIVPYRSGLPTIDMLGLNDAHIAHRELPLGQRLVGHEKHDAEYVLDREPDLIIVGLPELTPSMPASPEQLRRLVQRRTRDLPGDLELVADPRFPRLYTPVSVRVDGRGWLTMFARRESLDDLRLRR